MFLHTKYPLTATISGFHLLIGLQKKIPAAAANREAEHRRRTRWGSGARVPPGNLSLGLCPTRESSPSFQKYLKIKTIIYLNINKYNNLKTIVIFPQLPMVIFKSLSFQKFILFFEFQKFHASDESQGSLR